MNPLANRRLAHPSRGEGLDWMRVFENLANAGRYVAGHPAPCGVPAPVSDAVATPPGISFSRTGARTTGVVLVLALFALIILVAKSPHRLLYDEPFFAQYVALLQSYGFTAKFLRALDGGPGPLCAVVQAAFAPLSHLRPVAMRFVNLSLLVVVALVLTACCEGRKSVRWLTGFSVLIVPMSWVLGGMALSEMSAMLFVTLSLYFQFRGIEAIEGTAAPAWFLAGGVCLGIAVWGRQPYVLLAGVPILIAFGEKKLRAAAALFAIAAAAVAAPLFVIWRGLLSPSYHAIHSGISPVNGLISFGYAGFCFFILTPRHKWLPLKAVVPIIVAAAALNAVSRAFVIYPADTELKRLFPSFLVPVFGYLVGSLVLSIGVLFLAGLLRMMWNARGDARQLTVYAGLFCICVAPMADTHQYSSRYTAMSLPFLILAAHPWRRWTLDGAFTAALGCGIGFASLYGYFFLR